MAEPIALGVALTADASDFERGVASSEAAWTKLNGAFGTFGSTAATITGAFAKIGFEAPAEMGKVTAAVDGAALGFGRAQGALQELSTAAPRLASLAFGPVGIAIALAAAVGYAAWVTFKDDTFEIFGEVAGEAVTLSEAVGAAWSVVKDLASDAFKAVLAFAKEMFGQLMEWWDAMPSDAVAALGYLWDGAAEVFGKIGEFARTVFELIVGLAGAAVAGMIASLPALWEAYKNVFTQIGLLGAAAWESFKTGSTEPLVAQIKESGRSMVAALGQAGKDGSAAFTAALPPAFETLKTMAGAAVDNVKKRWKDAVVDIRDTVTDVTKEGARAVTAANAKMVDELIKQRQALQAALTNLERAGIAARKALALDALDRELRELQSSLALRRVSEEEYINAVARLKQEKIKETIQGLNEERDAVISSINQLIQQWIKLDAAGDTKLALATQTKIAEALQKQLELEKNITISQRESVSITLEQIAQQEALRQKRRDADAAALDAVVQYRQKLSDAGAQREFEISLIGKTREQQQILQATHAAEVELQKLMNDLRRIEVQITDELLRKEGARPDIMEALDRKQKELFQEAADARVEITRVETDARDKLNAESSQKFRDGLTDAITNGLMSGKGVGDSLRAYLKQSFSSLILRPTVSFLVNGLTGGGGSGGLGGLLSSLFSGGSGGGGGGGGVGGLLNQLFGGSGGAGGFSLGGISDMVFGTLFGELSSLTSVLLDTGLSYATALGTAASSIGGITGVIGSIGSAIAGAAEGTALALGAAAETASMIGAAAIPVIGWIVAIAGILYSLYGGDETGIKIDNSVRGVGNPASHFTQSGLGAFDVSGDIPTSAFAPFIKNVQAIDQLIIDNFLDDKTLAVVKERIQSVKNGDWFGFDDQASAGQAVNKASKRFLQERYGSAFDVIDAGVASMIRNFSGDADALLKFIDTTILAKHAIDTLSAAVPGFTVSLSAMLAATDDQRKSLTVLGALYKIETSDYVNSTREAIAASKRTLSEQLSAQTTASAAIAALQDGSLAKAQALAQSENARLTMFANLMQFIDQAATEINVLFANQAETFRLATFSEPQKAAYYDTKLADTLALLNEATDPTRIRELAHQYSSLLGTRFGLEAPEQQRLQGDKYGKLADDANAITQRQLAAAQAKAEAEATALSANIKTSITAAMALVATAMQTAADKMTAAANTMNNAANTTTTVVVTGKVTVELENNGNKQEVDVGLAGVQTRGAY